MPNYRRKTTEGYEISTPSLKRFIERMENNPVDWNFGFGFPRQIFNGEHC